MIAGTHRGVFRRSQIGLLEGCVVAAWRGVNREVPPGLTARLLVGAVWPFSYRRLPSRRLGCQETVGFSAMTQTTNASYLERRYEKNPHIVSRLIGDEFILVPVRHDVADLEAIYTLTGTGVRIWELMDGELTGHELRDRIVEEFDVGPEDAEEDLIQFLRQLEEINGVLVLEGD